MEKNEKNANPRSEASKGGVDLYGTAIAGMFGEVYIGSSREEVE